MENQPPTAPSPTLERALKALLITDLVDSTALVESLGDLRAAEIFAAYERTARDLLVKHNGLEIDKTDGFLIIFDRPIDAVLYALAVHDTLAEMSKEFHIKLAARAGIHLGEVVLRRNRPEHIARGAKPLEVEGLAKPLAARIMSLALGFQTLLTRSAFELARRAAVDQSDMTDDIDWLDHGVYRLKGIDEMQPVYEVGRSGLAPRTAPPSSEKAWRVRSRSSDENLNWRPGPGEEVPNRSGWKLERKIGENASGELWLGGAQDSISFTDRTLGIDANVPSLGMPNQRAFLFHLTGGGEDERDDSPTWQLSDPIACMAVISGAQEGTYVILTKKPFTCGRDATAELKITDRKVSRQHFEINAVNNAYIIKELRAMNGVFVNGSRISGEHLLQNEDEIRVGDTELVFYEDSDD